MKTLSDTQKLALCAGCRDNFYNGNNHLGVKRCWGLDSAEPVRRKFVHISACPPWDTQRVEDTLSCHRRHQYVAVEEDVNA